MQYFIKCMFNSDILLLIHFLVSIVSPPPTPSPNFMFMTVAKRKKKKKKEEEIMSFVK